MKRQLALLLSLPLAAGCGGAPLQWSKSGATAADLARDEKECNFQAKAAAAAIDDSWQRGLHTGEVRRACLEARGWELRRVAAQ